MVSEAKYNVVLFFDIICIYL